MNDFDWSAQALIDSGDAWRLEGYVGRQCFRAIEAGAAVLGPTGHRDYWGNYVPSRTEVEPGTKGSIEYAHERGHGDDDALVGPADECAVCASLKA